MKEDFNLLHTHIYIYHIQPKEKNTKGQEKNQEPKSWLVKDLLAIRKQWIKVKCLDYIVKEVIKKNYVKEEFYNKILTGKETEATFKKYDENKSD